MKIDKLIIIFTLFFINEELHKVSSHTCQYHVPPVSELVTGIKAEPLPPNVRRKRSTSPNLRIYFDYQSSFPNTQQGDILKSTVMEPARALLQSLLIPKAPNNGVLLINRKCTNSLIRINSQNVVGCAYGCDQTTCLNFVIPDTYLKQCIVMDSQGNINRSGTQGAGIQNADIVLLVTYTSCSGSTLAYAGSCFSESTLDRPILGVVNLCSNIIIPNLRVKENIKVVTHEIIHALGFAIDKYAFYRYPNGDPIVPRNTFGYPNLGLDSGGFYKWNDKIIQTVTRSRSSVSQSYSVTFNGFVLPNVLAATRNHFNCPTLIAVDLENYGASGDGSANSHFDEYFLYNELMTPQSNNGIDFLSNMTLALLQDTGWYNVTYNAVGNLDYGYQKGCLLPESGCYAYMTSQRSKSLTLDPFCNVPFAPGRILGCSSFRDYAYYCNLNKRSSVDPMYQYFTSLPGVSSSDVQFYSGSSPYNEYCPNYMVPTDPSFVCNNELNTNLYNPYNVVPSYFGTDSMCFYNNIVLPSSYIYYGASCQKYSYNSVTSVTTIYIGNSVFVCPSQIQQTYTLSDGKIVELKCVDDSQNQASINNKTLYEITTMNQASINNKTLYEITTMISFVLITKILIDNWFISM